jgi:hypothetical protein
VAEDVAQADPNLQFFDNDYAREKELSDNFGHTSCVILRDFGKSVTNPPLQ